MGTIPNPNLIDDLMDGLLLLTLTRTRDDGSAAVLDWMRK